MNYASSVPFRGHTRKAFDLLVAALTPLGFRPEAAHLNPAGALTGQVYATNMHGSYTMISVNLNGGDVVHIRGDRATDYPVGTAVRFDLDGAVVRYFQPRTEAAIQREAAQ